MPSPKQMEKLAREAARQPDREMPDPGPGDPLPDEHASIAQVGMRRMDAGRAGLGEFWSTTMRAC